MGDTISSFDRWFRDIFSEEGIKVTGLTEAATIDISDHKLLGVITPREDGYPGRSAHTVEEIIPTEEGIRMVG